ncbi:MAG TPA: helix-turn-helix domain-containing protein [Kofleriaceae bacterium]|nr:helix-turn-helix domain-containing protein [Kofleriaceae bacterium]
MSTSRRAAPLPPEVRRARIIAAALPLLRMHGTAVTTAQIAMAAGIAEGTLFRVFPDKDSLVHAAIATAFETGPTEAEIAAIDRELPLRDKLIAAVEVLQRRVEGVWQLMSMLGMAAPPGVNPLTPRPAPTMETLQHKVVALFEPHRDELRCEPAQAARVLRMMTFAGTHPRIADGVPLTAAEVVAVVLDGIRMRADLDPDSSDPDAEALPC